MNKLHLDTDFGGDFDDLSALALLMHWQDDVVLAGITTVGEINGRLVGAVRFSEFWVDTITNRRSVN